MILRSGFLSPGHTPFRIRIDEVPDGARKPRLEHDTGKGEQRQLRVIPVRHTPDEDVRVRGEPAEIELFAARRTQLRHPVHGEDGLLLLTLDVHLVPVAVVQVSTHGDDLGASAEVVAEAEGSFDELDLEEVVGACNGRVCY